MLTLTCRQLRTHPEFSTCQGTRYRRLRIRENDRVRDIWYMCRKEEEEEEGEEEEEEEEKEEREEKEEKEEVVPGGKEPQAMTEWLGGLRANRSG